LEDFVETIRPLRQGARDLKEIPRAQRLLHRPSLARMFTKAVQGDKPALGRMRPQAVIRRMKNVQGIHTADNATLIRPTALNEKFLNTKPYSP